MSPEALCNSCQFSPAFLDQSAEIVAHAIGNRLASNPAAHGAIRNAKGFSKRRLPLRPVERSSNVNQQVKGHGLIRQQSAVNRMELAVVNSVSLGGQLGAAVVSLFGGRKGPAIHSAVVQPPHVPVDGGATLADCDEKGVIHRVSPSGFGLIATTADHPDRQGKKSGGAESNRENGGFHIFTSLPASQKVATLHGVPENLGAALVLTRDHEDLLARPINGEWQATSFRPRNAVLIQQPIARDALDLHQSEVAVGGDVGRSVAARLRTIRAGGADRGNITLAKLGIHVGPPTQIQRTHCPAVVLNVGRDYMAVNRKNAH